MCIFCGISHPVGAPCDLRGVDSILAGRFNVQPIESKTIEPELEEPLNFEPVQQKKKGRPHGSRNAR